MNVMESKGSPFLPWLPKTKSSEDWLTSYYSNSLALYFLWYASEREMNALLDELLLNEKRLCLLWMEYLRNKQFGLLERFSEQKEIRASTKTLITIHCFNENVENQNINIVFDTLFVRKENRRDGLRRRDGMLSTFSWVDGDPRKDPVCPS